MHRDERYEWKCGGYAIECKTQTQTNTCILTMTLFFTCSHSLDKCSYTSECQTALVVHNHIHTFEKCSLHNINSLDVDLVMSLPATSGAFFNHNVARVHMKTQSNLPMVQWHPIDLCVWSHIKWGKENTNSKKQICRSKVACKFNLVKTGHLLQSLTGSWSQPGGISKLPRWNKDDLKSI